MNNFGKDYEESKWKQPAMNQIAFLVNLAYLFFHINKFLLNQLDSVDRESKQLAESDSKRQQLTCIILIEIFLVVN